MKLTKIQQSHWNLFKATRNPKTVAHVESILGEEISQDAFIIAHKRSCTNKRSKLSCSRDLYEWLVKMKFIVS